LATQGQDVMCQDGDGLAKWGWQRALPQHAVSMTECSGAFPRALPEQTVSGFSQYVKDATEGP